MNEQTIVTELELKDGYKFLAQFDQPGIPPLLMDEPAPLGEGTGPTASRVLSAAVGNCLSASALLCLRKAHIDVLGMHSTVTTGVGRNPEGRLRITGISVNIHVDVPEEQRSRLSRCMELFENFCIVTQSVRNGITVNVAVDTTAAAA